MQRVEGGHAQRKHFGNSLSGSGPPSRSFDMIISIFQNCGWVIRNLSSFHRHDKLNPYG